MFLFELDENSGCYGSVVSNDIMEKLEIAIYCFVTVDISIKV